MAIINKLKIDLLDADKENLTKRYTNNQEAYNLYLQGLYYAYRHTEETYYKSMEFFQKAIGLDNNYSLAYVGLANCYKELARLSWIPRDEGFRKAKELIQQALELDNTIGDAYAILAYIRFVSDWDIYGPDVDFRHALELSPNNVDIHRMYGQYLSWIGKHDESIALTKRAIELDPRMPLTNGYLGTVYFYAERFDQVCYPT